MMGAKWLVNDCKIDAKLGNTYPITQILELLTKIIYYAIYQTLLYFHNPIKGLNHLNVHH